ncbi:hypothetical protein OG223_48435 [Streptomyces sp. NBC_01478]|jgi:hypothetical protein|uniref:hypothetical protein n=1 Tax=Streptomyces sp. NBC_01478 TaxID=2903882 RepID=UPI002E324425|nr:hypothetical protein [Streptomyces sp. NBC_01478]
MATPQSAGRTLALRERAGRTTHDRDPATTDRSAGLRTTGHGRPDPAGTADLDVSHTPDVQHANRTLPRDIGRPSGRSGVRTRPRTFVV